MIDELAERIVERLLASMAQRSRAVAHGGDGVAPIPAGATHATAAQLAARFQLSMQWVESHAGELGATPISDSPNSKLRYHLASADAYMQRRRRPASTTGRSPAARKPNKAPPRTHTRSGRPLLDVI